MKHIFSQPKFRKISFSTFTIVCRHTHLSQEYVGNIQTKFVKLLAQNCNILYANNLMKIYAPNLSIKFHSLHFLRK